MVRKRISRRRTFHSPSYRPRILCRTGAENPPKAGPLEPFLFNAAQRQLHQIIEEQKAKTGKVRVIVLKARQLGVSTYVAARLYHTTINSPGLRTIIIGHERRCIAQLVLAGKAFPR